MDTDSEITDGQIHSSLTPEPQRPITGLAIAQTRGGNLEEFTKMLNAYSDWREALRQWILDRLEAGVHWGWPPGCEPKFDDQGRVMQKVRGVLKSVPREQWQPRFMLYEAGAEEILELFECTFTTISEMDAWKQSGSIEGLFFRKATIVSKHGEAIGEGVGAAKVGEKGWDNNQAVKMASKRAMVAATLATFRISGLLNGEEFIDQALPSPAPQKDHRQPQTPPRAERQQKTPEPQQEQPRQATSAEQIAQEAIKQKILKINSQWRHFNPGKDRSAFIKWCQVTLSITDKDNIDLTKTENWTPNRIQLAQDTLSGLKNGAKETANV